MTVLSIDDSPPYTPIINLIAAPLGVGIQFVLQEGDADGHAFALINQPQIEGSSTFRTPSANDVNEATLGDLSDLVGLVVINAPYAFDGTDYLRMTGELASEANPTLANVAAQDVRAFLYGLDTDTTTQAVRLRATAAGILIVNNEIAGTITTITDVTTGAAASVLAANLNRKQVIIQNLDATATNDCRIGESTSIGSARGTRLLGGESVTLTTTAEIFAVAVTGTPAISITEIEA